MPTSSIGPSRINPARTLIRSTTWLDTSPMKATVIGSRSQNSVSLSGDR